MKRNTIFNRFTLTCGLGVIALTGLSGCVTNGNPLTGLSGLPEIFDNQVYRDRAVVENEYLYYPEYDLYYDRDQREFLSVENDRWVTRNRPRNVSPDRVFTSRAVNLDGYTPQQHRDAYQQNRYRNSSFYTSGPNRDWSRADRRVSYRRY